MEDLSSRRRQAGYLLEVPLILAATVIVVSIVLPMLPPLGQKILLALAAIPVLFALFYMIVIPGWQPDTSGRLRWPWNWVVFLLIAGLILSALLAMLFGS